MYIKNHICRKERKFAKLYSKNDNISLRPLEVEASHFGMKFISISLRRAKQMRNIMYSRALFILHKNRHTIKQKNDVIEKDVFRSYSKENFVVL